VVEEVHKPGFVPTICYRFVGDVHSSRPAVTDGLERSTREQNGPPSPHLTLHSMGFTWPTLSPEPPVVPYTTGSTLPRTSSAGLSHRMLPETERFDGQVPEKADS